VRQGLGGAAREWLCRVQSLHRAAAGWVRHEDDCGEGIPRCFSGCKRNGCSVVRAWRLGSNEQPRRSIGGGGVVNGGRKLRRLEWSGKRIDGGGRC
jgi:hypothetical protein